MAGSRKPSQVRAFLTRNPGDGHFRDPNRPSATRMRDMTHRPSRALRAALVALPAALALTGCGNTTSPFDSGLAPLPITTGVQLPPPAGSGDPCGEGMQTMAGGAPGYSFAEGRACLHVPIAQVWAALQMPEVMDVAYYPDRDHTPACDARTSIETAYPISFRLHQKPGSPYSAFDYDVTWRGGLLLGTDLAPQEIALTYQKTWGTTQIKRLQGSMLLKESSPGSGWTVMEAVRQVGAPNTTGQMMEVWLQDWFGALRRNIDGTAIGAHCPVQ
jgi:hypothetical protein